MKNHIARLLALAVLMSGANIALAQNSPEVDWNAEFDPGRLIGLVVEGQRNSEWSLMEQAAHRLVRIRPHVGAYCYLLAKAYALADKKSDAYNVLLLLNNQGLSFDLSQDPDLENIRGTEVFDFLNSGFVKNALPTGEPIAQLELANAGLLADGLAWDPQRRQFLVGSITAGTVSLLDAAGKLQTLVTPDENNALLGVFDIAVDHSHRALWVTTAAVPHYRNIRFQDIGRTSVVEFDLDTAKVRSRYDLPGLDAANKLVNLAVGPDGNVFVANSGKPEVYRIDRAKKSMKRIFQAPNFTSLRGLAVSPDGKTLYFSDYELGVFGVNLADNKAFQVTGKPAFNLGGIDSLSWFEDGLIAVQNGNFPNRVYRLVLDGIGRTVVDANPLLVNHPLFTVPSEGIVASGKFHLLARNNAALFDERSGQLKADAKLPAQALLTIDPAAVQKIGPGM